MRVTHSVRNWCSTIPGSALPGCFMLHAGSTLVTRFARLNSTNIGMATKSTSLAEVNAMRFSIAICLLRNPWLRMSAFGSPVLPLVKLSIAESAADL